MSKDTPAKLAKQNQVTVYGHGPYDPKTGTTTGCADMGILKLNEHYTIVEVAYLTSLEGAFIAQKQLIEQLKQDIISLTKSSRGI